MTALARNPTVRREDGSLDLEAFWVAGVDSVATWLRERLTGADTGIALAAHEESPYELVTAIIRTVGAGHQTTVVLEQAVMRLLAEASAALPMVQPYLDQLLAICQEIPLPALQPWFYLQLEAAAGDLPRFRKLWPTNELQQQVVSSIALQAPATISPRAEEFWQVLLNDSSFTTPALYAYGTALVKQLPHIESWWNACADPRKARMLGQLIDVGLRENRSSVLKRMREVGEEWPDDLRAAADAQMASLGDLPIFAGQETPKELTGGKRLLDQFLLSEDPDERARVQTILKSPRILVIKSFYTSIQPLQDLHSDLMKELYDSPGINVDERATQDFEELADVVTSETKRVIYTFPLYRTYEKRNRLIVMPYGRQEEIGVLIPRYNSLFLRKEELVRDNRWNLETFISDTVAKSGKIYCPRNYALAEIVQQCAIFNPTRDFSATKHISLTAPPGVGRAFLPKATSGNDWVYLFDLGDLAKVKREVQRQKQLRVGEVGTLSHGLDIPVGVGFSMYMIPWLQENDHWGKLARIVAKHRESLAAPLEEIGISVNGWAKPKSNVVQFRQTA